MRALNGHPSKYGMNAARRIPPGESAFAVIDSHLANPSRIYNATGWKRMRGRVCPRLSNFFVHFWSLLSLPNQSCSAYRQKTHHAQWPHAPSTCFLFSARYTGSALIQPAPKARMVSSRDTRVGCVLVGVMLKSSTKFSWGGGDVFSAVKKGVGVAGSTRLLLRGSLPPF